MNKVTKYCPECTQVVTLSDDGYCLQCGTHADNMNKFDKMSNSDDLDDDSDL